MRARFHLLTFPILVFFLFFAACSCSAGKTHETENNHPGEVIELPSPIHESDYSLEKGIFERVSRRSFSKKPLTLQEAAQLLWAGQGVGVDGVTGASRTAPSAGATHPIKIYLVAGEVKGLEPGVYVYNYLEHSLAKKAPEDLRENLATAALNQHFLSSAPASIVLAADYDRTTARYGDRGIRYVHMEVGHITQNIYLQCKSLKLGTVAVGAFDDEKVKKLLSIEEEPLMIIPVGEISSR